MVSIIKFRKGKNTYYYLTHHNGSKTRRKYLGKSIPENIKQIKKEFLLGFYQDEWIPTLEKIRQNFIHYQAKKPRAVIDEELKDFSITFTYHTNKIEGSTLTRRDTERLLRDGITPTMKPKSDMIETELAQQVFFEMLKHEKSISLDTIRYWHVKMFNQTKLAIAGEIRDYDDITVRNSKAKFPLGDHVFELLVDFFRWYHKSKSKMNPVELAGLAHYKLVSIHPFGDGNGRISRLFMNCILDEYKYPMLNIEYGQKYTYYRALERANLANDEIYFLKWFVSYYIKQNKRYC